MKVFNNPHFNLQKSKSLTQSLQNSRVGDNKSDTPQIEISDMLTQLNSTQVDEQFDLSSEMHELKSKVLGLLKKYQVLLQTENAKSLKQQIKLDTVQIQDIYESIIERYQIDGSQLDIENKIPSIQQEKVLLRFFIKTLFQDLNNMFNLVEEFLERFTKRKAVLNYFSVLQQEKMSRNGIGVFETQDDPQDRSSMYDFNVIDLADSGSSQEAEIKAKIALSNSQKLRGQIRRRFFEVASKIKETLPLNSPGRRILISVLFEDAEDEGIEEKDWEDWLLRTLSK
ncbi:hypothetical protein pb186bvf_013485 [Paramecium bursaria]